MPSEEERPQDMPDPSDSYERSHPENEPGLGEMSKTDNTPHEQEDQCRDSRHNKLASQEVNAHEVENVDDDVDPTDARAHGDRNDADEAEATGRHRHGNNR